MLEVGKKAPDFELPDQNVEMHKFSDYAGKQVILYFYPKDNTCPVSYTHLMDDYLYIFDLQNNTFEISQSAVKRFNMSKNVLTDAAKMCIRDRLAPMEYKQSTGSGYQTGFLQNEKSVWSSVTVRRILENEIYKMCIRDRR